ncbi:MAG: M48 family metallopeptidase, partial [Desulfuromonadaceae bacterium]|nr:M48 family metallopeptidase [Desulfuromonadaceae bacterium]
MKILLFCLFAAITGFTYWLRHINLQHLKKYGNVVPEGFEQVVDEEKLKRSSAYTFDSSRLGLWSSLFDNVILVLFLFCGVIGVYDSWIGSFSSSSVISAILFFLVMTWGSTLLGIPFDLYGTFKIEARYGFNTTTARIWSIDFLKSQAITAVLLTLLVGVIFSLIGWSPEHWWIWVWGFMGIFSLFMMFISPYIIEPLFNSYEPVADSELQGDIQTMMEKAGLKVGKVLQMDASKRSNHSNAYFTGIGRVKRIVLYDTLIKQMSNAEIVAVLAHEIGHWKKGHIWKRLVWAEVMALAGSWLSFKMLEWQGLPGLLNLPAEISLPAKMVLLGFVASLVMFPLSPFSAWRSRC